MTHGGKQEGRLTSIYITLFYNKVIEVHMKAGERTVPEHSG